jgi:hypothetical protein
MPSWPNRQQLRALLGHWLDEVHRATPPVNEHRGATVQLEPPPSRLKQQTLPLEQALPSRQSRLAPGQAVLAGTHIVESVWKQQDSTPGTQVV